MEVPGTDIEKANAASAKGYDRSPCPKCGAWQKISSSIVNQWCCEACLYDTRTDGPFPTPDPGWAHESANYAQHHVSEVDRLRKALEQVVTLAYERPPVWSDIVERERWLSGQLEAIARTAEQALKGGG